MRDCLPMCLVFQMVKRGKFSLVFSGPSFDACCSGGLIYDQLGFIEQYTIL